MRCYSCNIYVIEIDNLCLELIPDFDKYLNIKLNSVIYKIHSI